MMRMTSGKKDDMSRPKLIIWWEEGNEDSEVSLELETRTLKDTIKREAINRVARTRNTLKHHGM